MVGSVVLLGLGEQDPVLGPLGAGQTGHHRPHVQLQHGAVIRCRRIGLAEHTLGPGVGLHQGDLLLVAAGQAQVVQALRVDREDAAGGAILRRHVGDGGTIGQRQVIQARAEEFHELADHAVLAQHLGNGQHEVRGGGAFGQFPGQAKTNDLRDEHGDGLAQHGRLGLDAAHAPTQHADAVDHGGVRVRADHGVRVGGELAIPVRAEDDPRQTLEVHLVDDACVGRHHGEVAEGALAPLEKGCSVPGCA